MGRLLLESGDAALLELGDELLLEEPADAGPPPDFPEEQPSTLVLESRELRVEVAGAAATLTIAPRSTELELDPGVTEVQIDG